MRWVKTLSARRCVAAGMLAILPSLPEVGAAEAPVATFSIVAYDSTNGEWGVAVASKFLGVGAVVPWAKAGVGAVATQAFANANYGVRGLELMEHGSSPDEALRILRMEDPQQDTRQVGMVDSQGSSITHTGKRCRQFAGGLAGPGFAVQGNLLAGESVIQSMVDSYVKSKGKPLSERLLSALNAGEKAGGDRRGRQSAALLVVKHRGGYGGHNDRYVDLRVDDHPEPVRELQRLYDMHSRSALPSVHARLGDQALEQGDRKTAEAELSRAVALYLEAIEATPRDPEPKNSLAWFYVQHRVNLDEALNLAEQARNLDPESWEVLDTLAEIHFAKGSFETAHEASLAALEAFPESSYLRSQVERFRLALEGVGGP